MEFVIQSGTICKGLRLIYKRWNTDSDTKFLYNTLYNDYLILKK